MKTGLVIAGGVAAVAIVAFATYMIDIDQTQSAALPDVDISVEGGQLPEFEAEVGSIDLGTDEVVVEVPDVEVTMEETTITVPTLNIDAPSDS